MLHNLDYVYNGVIVSGFESVTRFIKFGLFTFLDVYIKNIFGFRVKTKSMNLCQCCLRLLGCKVKPKDHSQTYTILIHVITRLHEQSFRFKVYLYKVSSLNSGSMTFQICDISGNFLLCVQTPKLIWY